MSDMDSNIDSGEGGVAASQTSGESAKPDSIDYSKIAAEVASRLKPDIEKMVQSTKDKRIEGLQQKYDKVLKTLDLTPDEAKTIGLSVPVEPKTETVAQQSSGKEIVAGAVADTILNMAGLASDDPDVAAFKQRTFVDDAEKVREAAMLVARKQSNPPAPKAPPEVKTSGVVTLDSKVEELDKELNKTFLDQDKIHKLQEEIKQLSQ